jgi:hypothetical protein
VFRNFESGNLRFQGADHLCFVKVRIRLWDDRSDDSFPEIIVGYANETPPQTGRCVIDVGHQHSFKPDRVEDRYDPTG